MEDLMSPFEMEAGLKALVAIAGETLRELRDAGALNEEALRRIGNRADEAAGHMAGDFGARVVAAVMARASLRD